MWCSIDYYETANSCRSVARTSNSSPFTALRNQELSSPRVRLLHHTDFLRMYSQSDDRIINFTAQLTRREHRRYHGNTDHHDLSPDFENVIFEVLFDFPNPSVLRPSVSQTLNEKMDTVNIYCF